VTRELVAVRMAVPLAYGPEPSPLPARASEGTAGPSIPGVRARAVAALRRTPGTSGTPASPAETRSGAARKGPGPSTIDPADRHALSRSDAAPRPSTHPCSRTKRRAATSPSTLNGSAAPQERHAAP